MPRRSSRTRTARSTCACRRPSCTHCAKAFVVAGGHWSTFIIWAKDRFTLGRSDYQRQFEPILYGWPEGQSHHWCGDRDQGDVWFIDRPHRNDLHPTMKPVGARRAGDPQLAPARRTGARPFRRQRHDVDRGGATGRDARLIELDPRYCRRHRRALADVHGGKAVLDGDRRERRRTFGNAALTACMAWLYHSAGGAVGADDALFGLSLCSGAGGLDLALAPRRPRISCCGLRRAGSLRRGHSRGADGRRGPGSARLSGTTLPPSTAARGAARWTSSLRAIRASRSASPANGAARTIRDISGRMSRASSAKCEPPFVFLENVAHHLRLGFPEVAGRPGRHGLPPCGGTVHGGGSRRAAQARTAVHPRHPGG